MLVRLIVRNIVLVMLAIIAVTAIILSVATMAMWVVLVVIALIWVVVGTLRIEREDRLVLSSHRIVMLIQRCSLTLGNNHPMLTLDLQVPKSSKANSQGKMLNPHWGSYDSLIHVINYFNCIKDKFMSKNLFLFYYNLPVGLLIIPLLLW